MAGNREGKVGRARGAAPGPRCSVKLRGLMEGEDLSLGLGGRVCEGLCRREKGSFGGVRHVAEAFFKGSA